MKKISPVDTSQDNLVAYVASVVIVALAIVIGIGWYYFQSTERIRVDVAYAKVGPLKVQTQGFTIRTTVAVQTRPNNDRWTLEQRRILESVFQKTLAETDPKTILTADGMQALQNLLKNAGNMALNTSVVQGVVLTDFLLVANEDQ